MAHESEDQLFARFGRSGDPELLAQVFDLTAAKLLRVAIHLCQDPAGAEDLVQATFVTAMEKAHSFDNGRPLLPWLTGILERHALASRARARRRIVPERLTDPLALNPEQHAQENELGEAVDAALNKLPEAQRTVLVLKLRHGMSPAQIADALGLAPGTVRVQLHRALEMLRRYLPASLALSAALAFTPTRGLAAMRTELTRHAAVQLASIGPGVILGGILMKKVVAALVLAAVVASAGVFIPWSGEAVNLPATQEAIAGMGEGISLGEGLDQIAIEADGLRSQEISAEPPQRTLAAGTAASGGQLLVRARWADDLSPAPGIGIEIRPHDGRHPQLHDQRKVTGSDGLVSFVGLAEGTVGIYVDRKVKKAGGDARREGAQALQALRKLEVAAILGVKLDGSLSPFLGPELVLQISPSMRLTEQDIVFQELELRRGLYEVALSQYESIAIDEALAEKIESLLDPLQLDFPSKLPSRSPISVETIGAEPVYIEILVERGIALSGKVVDATGQPIVSAEIWLTGKGMGEGQMLTRSDERGAFRLEALEKGSSVFARSAGFEPSALHMVNSKAGQQQETEFVLDQRAGILRGRVVDALGQPLAGATLRIGDPDSSQAPVFLRSDSEGQFQAVGLPRGNLRVLVLAPGFQPYQEMVVIQADVITERELRLQQGWVLAGRVLDTEGKGQEGLTIFADAEGKPTTEVTSGTDGSFRLETLPPGPVTLRIEENKFRALHQEVHGIAGEEVEQDLHLPAWGRIAGRLESGTGAALGGWRMRAIPIESGARMRTKRVDKDGSFEIKTEPELSYRIEVYQTRVPSSARSYRNATVRGFFSLSLTGRREAIKPPPGRRVIRCDWLGEIKGDREDLVIRIPDHLMPSAILRGQVLDANGQPLVGSVNIFVDDQKRRVDTADDGSFELGPLIPGGYRFQMVCKDESYPPFEIGPSSLAYDQTIDLGILNPPAGGTLAAELIDNRAAGDHGSKKVRILDNLGRLVKTFSLSRHGSTNTRLAPGDYRAEILDHGQIEVAKTFKIRSGTTTPLRLELND